MDGRLEMNRALWDEWADINARSGLYDLADFKRGGIRLRDCEIEEVGDVAGKSLLHLQWWMPGELDGTMPLMYSLKATKPA